MTLAARVPESVGIVYAAQLHSSHPFDIRVPPQHPLGLVRARRVADDHRREAEAVPRRLPRGLLVPVLLVRSAYLGLWAVHPHQALELHVQQQLACLDDAAVWRSELQRAVAVAEGLQWHDLLCDELLAVGATEERRAHIVDGDPKEGDVWRPHIAGEWRDVALEGGVVLVPPVAEACASSGGMSGGMRRGGG